MEAQHPLDDLNNVVQAAKRIDEVGDEEFRMFLYIRLMEIAARRWGWQFDHELSLGSGGTTVTTRIDRNGYAPAPEKNINIVDGKEEFPQKGVGRATHRVPINRDTVAMGSQPHKILLALQALATHAAPLSAADLRDVLDGVPKDSISTILAKLHQRKLVQRIATHDSDSGGKERAIFKYYIPEDQKIPELPKAKG